MKKWLTNTFEMNTSTSASRWYSMEGMRGIAVILVFFVHYHSVIGEFAIPDTIGYFISSCLGAMGHTGVDLFFVLSGYLIYGALIKREVVLNKFYKKRVIRIYPTFIAVFIFYLALSFLFPSESKIPTSGVYNASIYIFQNFLLLPGIFSIKPIITVAWSLSYEIFYYLVTPLLIVLLKLRNWKPLYRILFFLLSTVVFLYLCEIGTLSHARISMFMSGIILYELINILNILKRPPRGSSIPACILFLFAIISYGELTSDRYILFFQNTQNSSILATAILFFSFLFFVKIGLRETTLSKLLSFTPLRYLGT